MILKIFRYDKTVDYMYIDKINHIDFWKPRPYTKTGTTAGNNSEKIGDSVFIVDCEVEGANYYVADCWKDNGDHFLLGFDTYLILMNDDGKVIQKVVANTAEKMKKE